jgi:hypothetical protein
LHFSESLGSRQLHFHIRHNEMRQSTDQLTIKEVKLVCLSIFLVTPLFYWKCPYLSCAMFLDWIRFPTFLYKLGQRAVLFSCTPLWNEARHWPTTINALNLGGMRQPLVCLSIFLVTLLFYWKCSYLSCTMFLDCIIFPTFLYKLGQQAVTFPCTPLRKEAKHRPTNYKISKTGWDEAAGSLIIHFMKIPSILWKSPIPE